METPRQEALRPEGSSYAFPVFAVRVLAVIGALSVLDLAGAIALKEASRRQSPMWMFGGVLCFIMLAGLLYLALAIAELTVVSIAWIVLYQVGAVTVDMVVYRVVPTPVQAGALVIAVAALVVAALAPAGPQPKHDVSAGDLVPVAALPRPRQYGSVEQRLRAQRKP